MRTRLPALRHAPFEHVPHLELLARSRGFRRVLPLNENEDVRAATRGRRLRQRVDDLFGDAVAEVLVLGIGAHVLERQDRNGLL